MRLVVTIEAVALAANGAPIRHTMTRTFPLTDTLDTLRGYVQQFSELHQSVTTHVTINPDGYNWRVDPHEPWFQESIEE